LRSSDAANGSWKSRNERKSGGKKTRPAGLPAIQTLSGKTRHEGERKALVTKQEFVDRVAKKSGLSKREAAAAVDSFLETVTDALQSGDEVSFTGFGKFSVQNRAARQGVNPRNPSERVHIPAGRVPKFSAGSQLKRSVKQALAGDPGDVPWED
jgi:DNA-binding protein HU-beta